MAASGDCKLAKGGRGAARMWETCQKKHRMRRVGQAGPVIIPVAALERGSDL